MSGRWHVDGQPNDETFETEGEAIARAWELTPAGGTRSAVRQVSGVLRTDRIFDVPEKFTKDPTTYGMGGRTGATPPYAHMTPSKPDSINAHITAVEMVMERDKEFVRAVMMTPMSQVMAAFSTQQAVDDWMRLRFEVLVSDHIKEPVALTEFRVEIEEDPPPPVWTGTLSPSAVERQRMVARGTFERVSLPPF